MEVVAEHETWWYEKMPKKYINAKKILARNVYKKSKCGIMIVRKYNKIKDKRIYSLFEGREGRDVNKWIRKKWISKLHDWLFGCPLSLQLIYFYFILIITTLFFTIFTNTTSKL